NDLGDAKTMAHLLKHDSVLGKLEEDVEVGDGKITVGGEELQLLSERDPKELPWGDLGVDIVIESTVFFTDRDGASAHFDAGAAKVVIFAPATDAACSRGVVVPDLNGKVDGVSMRAPVPDGSVVDLVVQVARETNVDEVNELFRSAADSGPLEGLLAYSDEPLVSQDIVGSAFSCTFDSELTMVH